MSFPITSNKVVSNATQLMQSFNQLLTQLVAFFSYLNNKPQLDSILLTSVALKAGQNQVSHKLGKPPTGWTVVDNTANAIIWRSSSSNNTTLFLSSTAATTVSLVLF